MGRTVALLLSVAVLAGCGGDDTPAVPSDSPAPTAEAPDPVEAAPATTEPPAPLAPETEDADEDTFLVWGGVNAPSVMSLGPFEDEPACMGFEDFSGVREGMQVKILGASGNIVAVEELGPAIWSDEHSECLWMFTVQAPKGEGFYSAEIDGFGSSQVATEDGVQDHELLLILPD